MNRFWSKVEKTDGCWLWRGSLRRGYGLFRDAGKTKSAHRVVMELGSGPIPTGLKCLHYCDNPACVRPSHLFLGTQIQNIRDRGVKGRSARGEKIKTARLTESDVRAIKRLLGFHLFSGAELGRQFGVSRNVINLIRRGLFWGHVGTEVA